MGTGKSSDGRRRHGKSMSLVGAKEARCQGPLRLRFKTSTTELTTVIMEKGEGREGCQAKASHRVVARRLVCNVNGLQDDRKLDQRVWRTWQLFNLSSHPPSGIPSSHSSAR
jgi:hypothetical protein